MRQSLKTSIDFLKENKAAFRQLSCKDAMNEIGVYKYFREQERHCRYATVLADRVGAAVQPP